MVKKLFIEKKAASFLMSENPKNTAEESTSIDATYTGLWNPNFIPIGASSDPDLLLQEQYKTFSQTAENTSDRRLRTNAFFVTINTAILAASSYIFSGTDSVLSKLFAILALLIGISVSFVWVKLIQSFRAINTAKFEVLGLMEQRMIASCFWNSEWSRLHRKRKDGVKYKPLTEIESYIPKLMIIGYCLVAALGIASLLYPAITIDSSPPIRFDEINVNMKN